MNYGQVRDAALQLINRYSVAGRPVPAAYNNQADALNRIPMLINDGQIYLATTARKIAAAASLETMDFVLHPAGRLYEAPYDFFCFRGGGLLDLTGGCAVRKPVSAWVTNRQFLVGHDCPQGALLEYWRFPHPLPAEPEPTRELDNDAAAHQLLPYYVAAQLMMDEDAFVYQALHNEFEVRLAQLAPAPLATEEAVGDVYGGFGGCME